MDSGTSKIAIFRWVDGVQSTYPVSLITGSTPLHFDVVNSAADTVLYYITDQEIVNEHLIDFTAYKSSDTLRSKRLNTKCDGIKVVGSLILASCDGTLTVIDRASLSTVATLDTNKAQFLTKQTGI